MNMEISQELNKYLLTFFIFWIYSISLAGCELHILSIDTTESSEFSTLATTADITEDLCECDCDESTRRFTETLSKGKSQNIFTETSEIFPTETMMSAATTMSPEACTCICSTTETTYFSSATTDITTEKTDFSCNKVA